MATSRKVSKGDLKKITKKFRNGDYTSIAEKTGFERSYVWRVLNGERGANPTIISAATKMVSKRK